MAYTKKTWVNGEVIDAAKLNNIESGVAASENTAAEAKTAATEAKADAAVAKTDAAEAKTVAAEAKAEATEAKGNATEANTNALAAQSTADVNKQDIATLVEIASGLREDVNAAEANADEAKTNAVEALEKANGHDADLATMLEIMGGLRTDVNAAKTNADEAKTNATEAKAAVQQSVQSTLQVLQSFGNRVSELEENALTEADKPGIVTDTLNALAGADPNNATAAVVQELTGRTDILERKVRYATEDIAELYDAHDNFETLFVCLHQPMSGFDPEDMEKMSFVYTSWINGYETNEWYDDITLMSPTGDVYAGKKDDNNWYEFTRKKLATEEYVQNAMILTAPNGNRFRLTVDNNGNLGTVAVD